MTPKSSTLFHFTKSNEALKLVLKNGLWPRYCLEDIDWLSIDNLKFVAFPMVCFCDIPLSRIDEHVKFYGEFGVGLTKEWAMTNGLTPVHYVSPNSEIPNAYISLVNILATDDGEEDASNGGWDYLRYILAHAKPIEGNMVVGSELIEKDFHQESEWRYIAKHDDVNGFISKSDFEKEELVAGRNNETKKNCMLKFSPKDIKYIFVKTDSYIPEIINFIQAEMDQYPSSDLKVLMSRVISLESISGDL